MASSLEEAKQTACISNNIDMNRLINYLVGENDINDIGKLESIKILLINTTQSVSSMILKLKHQNFSSSSSISSSSIDSKVKCESSFLTIEDTQFIEPRGRFRAQVSSQGISIDGKQLSCFLAWSNIRHIMCIGNHTTTKKEGEDILAIQLENPIKNNNKDMKGFLWVLNKSEAKQLHIAALNITGTESHVITSLIDNLWKSNEKRSSSSIVRPRSDLFQSVLGSSSSSSSSSPKPLFLRCYRGIQEGVLYPLSNGLLFIKPMFFIDSDDIASLSAGRGGSSGNTRFVDLVIETSDGKKIEFTNIEREELAGLQYYVKGYLEARTAQFRLKYEIETENGVVNSSIDNIMSMKNEHSLEGEGGGGGGVDNEDREDDSSDDDDYDPAEDSSDDDSDDSSTGSSGSSSDSDDNEGKEEKGAVRTRVETRNKKSQENPSITTGGLTGHNKHISTDEVSEVVASDGSCDSDSDSSSSSSVELECISDSEARDLLADCAGDHVDMSLPLSNKRRRGVELELSSSSSSLSGTLRKERKLN